MSEQNQAADQQPIFNIQRVYLKDMSLEQPNSQLELILGISCPNILYPYLRANIADTITRAGFPPIHLNEINFEAFYQQRKQAIAESAAAKH